MNTYARPSTGIRCPLCGHSTKVIESYAKGRFEVRRRRECRHCKFRISTSETIRAPKQYRPKA